MKREDLFLAIGEMEESRLARSELTVQEPSAWKQMEETDMQKKHANTGRIIRNVLVAAVIASLLAVTAFAVGSFLIFDSPEEMLTAIFGDDTGFDHSAGSIKPDPWGGPEGVLIEPTFDRVPADEAVVEEDIAPYVDIVGQSIRWKDYTLTVDAFAYDSVTRCGFFTYLLENPNGVSGYQLQSTGEIWYDGMPDIVEVNQYGYPYIIREKTTDTCLAAIYYFKNESRRGDSLEISFSGDETQIPDEKIAEILTEIEQKLRKTITPEQAVDQVIDIIGAVTFEENTQFLPDGVTMDMETYRTDYAYTVLTHEQFREQYQESHNKLVVDFSQEDALRNVTMEKGSVVVTPISMQIDVTDLTFLHETHNGQQYIHAADNIDAVTIRYQDGTEYIVDEGYTENYTFAVCGSATNGEKDNYNMLTYMFNRIIDVDEVTSVIINGTELPVD